MTTPTVSADSIVALRRALSGPVTTPADTGWDGARGAWDLAADQRPAMVVHAETAADVGARRARVGAGVRWQAVTDAAAPHGRIGLAGTSAGVRVVGYTLGGDLGWLSRRYGLACNHVRAVELVTGEGEHVRADAETEPELFWALRGGGGNLGVVTALEFSLAPVGEGPRRHAVLPRGRHAGGPAGLRWVCGR